MLIIFSYLPAKESALLRSCSKVKNFDLRTTDSSFDYSMT